MNCIKDGKYTGDSCFGCKIKVKDCEIRDKVYQRRWIPANEKSPDKSGYYLVTKYAPVEEETVDLIEFCHVGKKWNSGYSMVMAWQPLPEPYKEESE